MGIFELGLWLGGGGGHARWGDGNAKTRRSGVASHLRNWHVPVVRAAARGDFALDVLIHSNTYCNITLNTSLISNLTSGNWCLPHNPSFSLSRTLAVYLV